MEYEHALRILLAAEYNCAPEDFERAENVITESALREGRRRYGSTPYFFHMVTLGKNAVLTADQRLHPYLQEFAAAKPGHRLFEMPKLFLLERVLRRFGYTLSATYHMFLPRAVVQPIGVWRTAWFFGKEIHPFYAGRRFPNALASSYTAERPDTIAVCAYQGDTIMGMAGCSEDAPHWQQIGVDVMPEYRAQGIGTYLVTLLKNRILQQGDIPFYGTSLSNYDSWNVALNAGFRPAWVEIGANRVMEP